MSLDRYEKSSEKHHQHYGNSADDHASKYTDSSLSRTMQSSVNETNRYGIVSCQDSRFGQSTTSALQIGHHGYIATSVNPAVRSSSSSSQTTSSGSVALSQSAALADRYSRYTEASSLSGDQRIPVQPNDRFQQGVNDTTDHNAYNHGRGMSSSSSDDRSTGHNPKVSGTSEYANSSVIVSSGLGIAGVGSTVGGCTNGVFSPDTFPSPPSPAPASDRFVPPPPLSPSPSEKYVSSQSLSATGCYSSASDRILPPSSPTTRDRYVTAPASPLSMSKESRYSAMSSDRGMVTERGHQSSLHEAKEHQQQPQRYGTSSTERLLASASPVLGALQSRDTENNRCGIFQAAGGIKESSSSGVSSRYSISTDRLMSSSPIHAPVPERFAAGSTNTDRYISNESPNHETMGRYHHRQEGTSNIPHERYSTSGSSGTDRYLSNSPNPEGSHGRYSSSERVLGVNSSTGEHVTSRESRRYSTSDRSLEGICQKYAERGERGCSNSPANADYSCRFSGYQEVTMQPRYPSDQRFSELGTHQRYGGQSSNGNNGRHDHNRTNDRFVNSNNNDRYLSNSSPGHDNRLGTNSDGGGRYSNCGSSTERLLASSSSPSTSDTGRYHSLYTGTNNCNPTKNDRYGPLSPTPENNQSGSRSYSQQGTTTKPTNSSTNDKYIQVSKSLQISYGDRYHQVSNNQIDQFDRINQERSYTIDRYGNQTNTNNSDSRYQVSGNGNSERFHSGNTERYSPGRSVHPDKYLSLPKPKDNFSTSRIVASCSALGVGVGGGGGNASVPDRSYGSNSSGSYVPPNAHTPVERYVPQPPPEVLYPDRYVDRYVPPAAHTPTDRYVPAADPGDPYMRRDLGFHHHYRLPPPGYPYHQTHFRFRSFAYASPGRLGGSPGSSSSSSSTSAQREFSTSPLLRPKVRNSTIDSTNSGRQINAASQATCCADSARNCCAPLRRSLPPGALPSIPNQSAHSSW